MNPIKTIPTSEMNFQQHLIEVLALTYKRVTHSGYAQHLKLHQFRFGDVLACVDDAGNILRSGFCYVEYDTWIMDDNSVYTLLDLRQHLQSNDYRWAQLN